jgi:hypothetical protein
MATLKNLGQEATTPLDAYLMDAGAVLDSTSPAYGSDITVNELAPPASSFDNLVSGAVSIFKGVQAATGKAPAPVAHPAATVGGINIQAMLVPALALIALFVLMRKR